MRRKFEGVGRLLVAYFGDVPLGTLDDQKILDFLLWYRRLPKTHGRAHGRNRYTSIGVEPDPHAEIARADAEDETNRLRILDLEGLSDLDRRARLADELVARVTDASVEKAHARLTGLFEHAVSDKTIQHRGYVMKSLLPRFRKAAEELDNKARNEDPFAIRATRPKVRSAWSNSRIARLANSPVYRGCSTPHRRWKAGALVLRDALYWGPIALLTTGLRPEELLQLRKRNVVRRDEVWAFQIAVELDQSYKTRDSIRYVPVPQVLVDLGFIEWWSDRLGEAGQMLFPDIASGTLAARLSDAYGKRVRLVFDQLDIRDPEEDLYALRKTFSSRLQDAGVQDSLRKAILGHAQPDILNRHYTQENLALLKQAIDSVDLGMRVEMDAERGHPVIVGCDLPRAPEIDVDLKLDDHGAPRWIRITRPGLESDPVLETGIQSMPGWSASEPPAFAGGTSEDARQVARQVVKIIDGHEVRLNRRKQVQAAFEALCACAHVAAAAA